MVGRRENITRCPSCGVRLKTSGAGRFRCPACGAIFEVSEPSGQKAPEARDSGTCEFHPSRLATHICQVCGALICSDCAGNNLDYPVCPRCRGESYRSESAGDWKSYFTDLGAVLFKPQEFFSSVAPKGSVGRALLFGVGWATVGSFVGSLWSYESVRVIMEQFQAELGTELGGTITWGPLGMLANLFGGIVGNAIMIILGTLFIHLCLMIYGGANRGLETSLKALAYSHAAMVWNAVPLIGAMPIAPVWWVVCATVGLKNMHRTTTTKALFAVLTPMLLMFALLFFVLFILFATVAGAFLQALGQMQM